MLARVLDLIYNDVNNLSNFVHHLNGIWVGI